MANTVKMRGDLEITHEYSDIGSHRLILKSNIGDWASYTGIATVVNNSRTIYATTQYYLGSLPEMFYAEAL